MAKEKKQVNYQETNTVTDGETGEVKQTTETKRAWVSQQPDYVKMYLKDMFRLMELNPSYCEVLLCATKYMGKNNIFPALKYVKERIAEETGLKVSTINMAIFKMKAKGILIQFQRGIYIIDPEIIGRGKWEDVERLRTMITYDKDGQKKVKGNFSEEIKSLSGERDQLRMELGDNNEETDENNG